MKSNDVGFIIVKFISEVSEINRLIFMSLINYFLCTRQKSFLKIKGFLPLFIE